MLHDPDAFTAITRRMREGDVGATGTDLPSIGELLRRIDQALDGVRKDQKGPTAKPPA